MTSSAATHGFVGEGPQTATEYSPVVASASLPDFFVEAPDHRLSAESPAIDAGTGAQILHDLGIRRIRLLTNNPKKIEDLTQHGIVVNGRIPHIMQANEHNRFYLETKVLKSGHMIDLQGKEHLPEQADPPVVEGMDDEQIKLITELYLI